MPLNSNEELSLWRRAVESKLKAIAEQVQHQHVEHPNEMQQQHQQHFNQMQQLQMRVQDANNLAQQLQRQQEATVLAHARIQGQMEEMVRSIGGLATTCAQNQAATSQAVSTVNQPHSAHTEDIRLIKVNLGQVLGPMVRRSKSQRSAAA